jgi:hypothetical protein
MNHAQKYLAQANRQIAELAVQIATQRAIVKHALDTGQRSEMADSLLDALEGSLAVPVSIGPGPRRRVRSARRQSIASTPGRSARLARLLALESEPASKLWPTRAGSKTLRTDSGVAAKRERDQRRRGGVPGM